MLVSRNPVLDKYSVVLEIYVSTLYSLTSDYAGVDGFVWLAFANLYSPAFQKGL